MPARTAGLVVALALAGGSAAALSADPHPAHTQPAEGGSGVPGSAGGGEAGGDETEEGSSLRRRFEQLVGELDAEAWQRRHEAFEQLLDLTGIDLEMVESMLEDPSLSAEARWRLERVAFEVFRESPRAGMGVRFEPQGRGVEITGTVEGFDAERVLRRGDVLIEADGRRIEGIRDLQAAIIATDPGHEMELVLRRTDRQTGGTERLRVECAMGSYERLGNPGPIDPDVLRAAWQVRRGDASGDRASGPRIRLPAPAGGNGSERTPAPLASLQAAVIAGGTGRGGADAHGRLRVRVMDHELMLPGTEAAQQAIRSGNHRSMVRLMIEHLDQQRRPLRSRLMDHQGRLRDPNLGEQRRAEIQRESTATQRELERIEREIETLWSLWQALPDG